ncbi:cell division protein FtsQ/DivIB [Larsenimonas salina]|uniref:cell division protein FtsQ/DivIB n=1 Tax=Larsenimonas salina TaxID=1295565 RepID=UPI002073F24A|nr:cell division protein FtsQ/DivIB [Larsenimonas salina]MCM5703148.1 cell division protein FtsQ/DivIB [Larsenimonas salina]
MAGVVSNRLLGLVLIVALIGAGGRTLWLWLDKPVARIAIRGDLAHIDQHYLNERLTPLVRGKTWLSVDLNALKDEASSISWIKSAEISRRWPSTLVFHLTEQRPIAYWQDGELLNRDGKAFNMRGVKTAGDLPHLGGPPGSGSEVVSYFEDLKSTLAPLDMSISQLRLEPRGAWRFQINDNFWVMIGRTDREQRLKRFIAAWQRDLKNRSSNIRYIDLRYPNGIAVSWHGTSATAG